MYCVKKVTEDLTWIGGNDRRLSLFEGVYAVPDGVSYNSYFLSDEKTVLFDTVDRAVEKVFFENLEHVLDGRALDYVVVHHVEPDHSFTLGNLIERYPDVTVVCNQRAADMIKQFFGDVVVKNWLIVSENDTLQTGKHKLTFFMTPMVHWPEVMMSFDERDKVLFSADAFGAFGAQNGTVFADQADFYEKYMDEARRYYCNIVGKYGAMTQLALKKASAFDVKLICPLHGYIHRKDLDKFIDKYDKWSRNEAETNGVVIAFASIYGNTENAVEILAAKLGELGVKTVMFDVSVTPSSQIVAALFQHSAAVFASPTYNAGVFVSMENLLSDVVAHNVQNKKIAIIENGSWAPVAGSLMKASLQKLKNVTFVGEPMTIKSSVKDSQRAQLELLAQQIKDSL